MRVLNLRLHPYSLLITFILIILGTFITHELILLMVGYSIVLLLLFFSKQILPHIKMFLVANLPFLLLLLLVYGVILKNQPLPNNISGVKYSLFLFLRVSILTSLFQYLLNAPSDELLFSLKKIRLNATLLIIVISSFSVWKDFISKADRIVTARLARGYLKNRNFINRIRQLPYVIRPLFASTLILALERAASWKQRNLLTEIGQIKLSAFSQIRYSKLFNIIFPIIVIVWLLFIFQKFPG